MEYLISPASNRTEHINSRRLGRDHPAKYGGHSNHRNKALFEPPVQAGPARVRKLGWILGAGVRLGFTGIQRGVNPLRYIVILLELSPSLVHIGDTARGVLILSLFNHLQDMKNHVLIPWLCHLHIHAQQFL